MARHHLSLFIPELLPEIFEYLSAKELMVAAIVCRAWCAPVMDTRWRTQPVTLSRLLTNLAPIEKIDKSCRTLASETDITQDHWNSFLEHYANRITRLHLDRRFDDTSITLISTLLEKFGGQFGNNLISLTWTYLAHNGDPSWTLLDLLPGKKLQEVNLPFRYNPFLTDASVPTSLSKLATLAPHISKLGVHGLRHSFDCSVFRYLRTLSYCGYLSTSDYHNLMYCPYLEVLAVGTTVVQAASVQQTNLTATTFSRLEDFQFSSCNDEMESMVLRSVMPALRSFKYFGKNTMGPFTPSLGNNLYNRRNTAITIGTGSTRGGAEFGLQQSVRLQDCTGGERSG
ncbi:hypothetical protein FRB93_002762 [Tulasnella sp. JGI-2019a]|nr:hypothetical protein FRB93_002762 [Tulasnella sp. JGI-2019a]